MTHLGWHAREFDRFNARNNRSAPVEPRLSDAHNKPRVVTRNGEFQPAANPRRGTRQVEQRPKSHPQQVRRESPAPQSRRASNRPPRAAKRKRTRHLLFNAIMVPAIGLAMFGLFAMGYKGGRLMVGYLDQAAIAPVLVLPEAVAQAKQTIGLDTAPSPATEVEPASAPAPDLATSLVNLARASVSLPPPVAPPAETTEPSQAPVQDASQTPLDHAAKLVGEGQGLLSNGDVLAARDYFNKGLKLGLPEAALALGRSYDPKFLALLPARNAQADVSIATSMYREWYRRSVAAGTIAEGVQFDKLIQSMKGQ